MKRKYAVARGFTFLEILVVVAILMILAYQIVPRTGRLGIGRGEIGEDGKPYEGRLGRAKLQMTEIGKALYFYKLDNGHFPTTEQGLLALVEEPSSAPRPGKWKQYLDRLPVDPWKESFIYRCPRIRYEKYAGGYLRISRETCDPSPLSEMKSRSLARYRITDEEMYSTFSLTCEVPESKESTQHDMTIDEVNNKPE